MPGAIAFYVGDLVDLLTQFAEQIPTHAVLEHDEPLFVELTPLCVRHG
jgi:hypothetical protein